MGDEIPLSRPDPVIKKLDNPLFHSIFTPELNTLAQIFKKHNHELKIAGGAVRDILMDIKPMDLDFATDATPQEMKNMFEEENIRMINNNGEKHEGRLYDYFFGYDDLMKRKVIFVGNPVHRIKEDYLRILRYFRFFGKISDQPDAHDEYIITAIKENIHGLEIISGERIWSEWSKILSGNYVKEITFKILECGIARFVGLPINPNIEKFEVICNISKKNNISLQPITFLAVMLRNENEVFKLHRRLKLSAYDRDLALFLISFWEDEPSIDLLKFYKGILIHWKGNVVNAKEYICELLKCKQYFVYL
ncbi:CCA tRNA nucleotidyltransferase 1, mitochondrial [Melipona quadrifasciata]|uniref:CCA tRNA nucleotidyltransferase 1, mitochondrial n=1 Tax=Melipona quadrifasciata TaxID=166423 RepID=A0A0M9A3X5_9HYME|nr:CCA tRNA nucleotidyltransferase 1, mitochondrial [Melipona quadrifasciata]